MPSTSLALGEAQAPAIPANSESIREIAAIRRSSRRNIRKIELGLTSESQAGIAAQALRHTRAP